MSRLSLIFILAAAVLVSGCISQLTETQQTPDETAAPEASPQPESPAEPEEAQQRDIESMAVSGDFVSLANCEPDPKVLRVEEGVEIRFDNPDNVQHRIFLAGSSHRIHPDSYTEMFATFPSGKTTYGYECDGIENAGYIIVE